MGVEGPPGGGKERHGGRWDTALCRKIPGTWGQSLRTRILLVEGFPSEIRIWVSSGAKEPLSPRLRPGQLLVLEEHSGSASVG